MNTQRVAGNGKVIHPARTDRDIRALARKFFRDRAPKPLAASGYECDLAPSVPDPYLFLPRTQRLYTSFAPVRFKKSLWSRASAHVKSYLLNASLYPTLFATRTHDWADGCEAGRWTSPGGRRVSHEEEDHIRIDEEGRVRAERIIDTEEGRMEESGETGGKDQFHRHLLRRRRWLSRRRRRSAQGGAAARRLIQE